VRTNISEKYAVLLLQKSCASEKESLYLHISCAHTGSFLLDTSGGHSLQPTYLHIKHHTHRVYTLALKMEAACSSKTLLIYRRQYMDSQSKIPIPEFLFFFTLLPRIKLSYNFQSHVTHVYYVHIHSSDQNLSFLSIWYCFMISAIVLWYQFKYQSQILLKTILITLCC